jgi:hypothetical protein
MSDYEKWLKSKVQDRELSYEQRKALRHITETLNEFEDALGAMHEATGLHQFEEACSGIECLIEMIGVSDEPEPDGCWVLLMRMPDDKPSDFQDSPGILDVAPSLDEAKRTAAEWLASIPNEHGDCEEPDLNRLDWEDPLGPHSNYPEQQLMAEDKEWGNLFRIDFVQNVRKRG